MASFLAGKSRPYFFQLMYLLTFNSKLPHQKPDTSEKPSHFA